MKDKFKKAIKDYTLNAHINVGRGCNHTTYIICRDFDKLAEKCNTLHQQAMKDGIKDIDRLKVIIFNLEDEVAEK